MVRPPALPPEEKARVVLSILVGEMTVAEAARRVKVSERSVGNWKRQFLESGRAGLAAGKSGPSSREQQLEAQVADLTQALGEAAVEPRVWKKSAEGPAGLFEDLEVIRTDAGMPTARFCRLIGVPERTWRRHQARDRQGTPVRGLWPRPAREMVREAARWHALGHPAWGHRKVWAMCRHEGHRVSQATMLRLLREEGLLLEANYQRERRQLSARRKAAFATEPTGPNQVWQLDFSEFETAGGGIWRLAGCRDYWSKYELGRHISPTANQHDAIAAIELALKEAELLAGKPPADLAPHEADGAAQPLVTIVTDNGGPFRSFRFEAFIAMHPKLRHVRTRVRTPGQNGSRERGLGSLKYEKPFLEEILDALDLARHAEDYRVEYNTIRPHEAPARNRPHDVHVAAADPLLPNFPKPENLPVA